MLFEQGLAAHFRARIHLERSRLGPYSPRPYVPQQAARSHQYPAFTEAALIAESNNSLLDDCLIERRSDGAVLVRVLSRGDRLPRLPDAVFTFRAGDPQFDYWH